MKKLLITCLSLFFANVIFGQTQKTITLGGISNNYYTESGSVVGSDIVLKVKDQSDVVIDVSGISGSSSASDVTYDNTFI